MSAVFDSGFKYLDATLSSPVALTKCRLLTGWVKWVGTQVSTATPFVIVAGADGAMRPALAADTGMTAVIRLGGAPVFFGNNTPIVTGVWTPIAIYMEAGTSGDAAFGLDINGTETGNAYPVSGSPTSPFSYLRIGQDDGYTNWLGKIAQVAVWSLDTVTDVQNVIDQLLTLAPTDVVGYTPVWYASLESDATATGGAITNNGSTTFDGADNPPLGGDTTAPILTSAVGTATGATTANGSVTTDEAGPAWAVLTTSSSTPSPTQIKAGQDHTGAFAAASDTATLVVGANTDVFSFSGLAASTAYWEHVVQDDTATPTVNTSAPITSASSFTTDAPSDPTPPTMNGSITVGTKTANSISISYSAASDNVGVAGYEVSSNGGASWSDNGTSLSYTFLGLAELTAYDLAVRAYDAAGNRATPITVNTSTYRSGGTVQDVYDNTGPVGGNPQGVLYATAAALVGTEPNSWLSYYTVSGPTPSGGTLDASPLGDFEYFGPDAAVWTIQPERNGVDYGDPVVVELYDQTPELSSPTGTATGATTATGTVVTDRGTGTLFFLASTNASEDGAAVAAGSSQAVSAVGTQNVDVSSLTGSTGYYLHYMHRSPSGYDSAVVSSESFTTDAPADVTPPDLSGQAIDSFGHNSATATVVSNEAGGSLYFVATENASELDAVVQAGSSQPVTAAGLQVVNLSGLTPETIYYVHFQQIDAAGNESNVVTAGPFTTSAAPAPGNGGALILIRRRRRK